MDVCGVACAGWALVGVGVVLAVSSVWPDRWSLRRG
jgi:hypothetical protein